MSNAPDTVEERDRLKREVSKLKTREENLSRELHRWQTGTQIEGDYVTHWVTRSEFEAVSEERDRLKRELAEREENKRSLIGAIEASNRKLEEQLKLERDGLRKELSEKDSTIARLGENLTNLEQLRVEELQLKAQECLKLRGELAEAKADSKAPAWDQYHGAVARAEELEKDRDRLRKLLKEAGAKGANYKREIRRLQDALLRQRGQHRWVEIERLEQRVKALESKGEDSAVAQELAAADAIVAKYRHEIRQQKMDTIAKYLRAVADSGVAPDDAERLLDVLEDIDNGDDNA